jgi:monoamine oxidase
VSTSAFDIIVIGAGAAGLAAAAQLAGPVRRVLLLEARDRIGGRIWTRRESGLSAPIELGAEFIHGHAELTRTLLARVGASVIESSDARCTLKDGLPGASGGSFASIQQALSRHAAVLSREDMTFDRFLEEHLAQMLSAEERAAARMLAEGFDAADPARASARALVAEWMGDTLGDVPQSRPQEGYEALLGSLSTSLAREHLRVRLGARVSRIRWSRGSVEVSGEFLDAPFEFYGTQAVIALPLGVLQADAGSPGAVSFDPPLSDKRAALAKLASGPVIKLVLRFATPFWETLHGEAWREVSFFHVADAPFRTFWTQAPVHAPLLVAWAGGPRAERLARAGSAGAITEQALQSLEQLFGAAAPIREQLETCYWHDWQQDPYARGAYSYVLAGGSEARAQLARPLEHTLFFAGEATDTADEAGTVTGALQSGLRVAREVQQG